MASEKPTVSRREQNKQRVRVALVREATRLFAARGFEATTIDDIVEEAGVSRRTFFRYFATKESIAFPFREERLAAFEALIQRDLADRPPLEAVREACLGVGKYYAAEPDRELTRQRIVDESPTLVAAELEVYDRWERAIAEAVTPKRASAKRRRQARIFAAATIGVLRTTLREWYESDCSKNLLTLGRQAFDLLEQGFGADAMT